MTVAIKPTLPDGTIRSQDADGDFQDYVTGRPLSRRILLVEIEPGGITGKTLDKGRVTGTTYTVIHAAEIRDSHEADLIRHRILQIRGEGGFYAKQPGLFDATDAEKRDSLLDMIKDWASEQNLPMTEVDKKWVHLLGGGDNASETVQASRSLVHLQEFAYHVGVLAETKPKGETDPEPELVEGEEPEGDDSGDGSDTLPQDGNEPSTTEPDEPDEDTAAPAALRSVPFQEQA